MDPSVPDASSASTCSRRGMTSVIQYRSNNRALSSPYIPRRNRECRSSCSTIVMQSVSRYKRASSLLAPYLSRTPAIMADDRIGRCANRETCCKERVRGSLRLMEPEFARKESHLSSFATISASGNVKQ